ADGGDGGEDGFDGGRRVGHHRYVRSRDFGDDRACPLRHAALGGRRYDAVLGSDHGPARYGLPGSRLRRRRVRTERDRTLARDDQPPVRLGEVLREGIVNGRWLEEGLGVPFRSSRVADDVENGGRVGNVERGARAAQDLEDGLAHFGDERVDVYERLDVTTYGTGVRDHHAPIGVADQDDRTSRALREKRRNVRGVSRHPVEEVG